MTRHKPPVARFAAGRQTGDETQKISIPTADVMTFEVGDDSWR